MPRYYFHLRNYDDLLEDHERRRQEDKKCIVH